MDSLENLFNVFGPIVYRLVDEPESERSLLFYILAWLLLDHEQARLLSIGDAHGEIQYLMQHENGTQFHVLKPHLSEAEDRLLHGELIGWVRQVTARDYSVGVTSVAH